MSKHTETSNSTPVSDHFSDCEATASATSRVSVLQLATPLLQSVSEICMVENQEKVR